MHRVRRPVLVALVSGFVVLVVAFGILSTATGDDHDTTGSVSVKGTPGEAAAGAQQPAPVSVRDGCGRLPPVFPTNPATGTPDVRASPLFILEVAHVDGTGDLFVGCFPREFEFSELDGGKALQDIRDRSGVSVDPPTPLFDLNGNLAGYNIPGRGFVPLDVALELDAVQRLQAQHVPSEADYGRGVVVPSDPNAKPDNTGEDEERQRQAREPDRARSQVPVSVIPLGTPARPERLFADPPQAVELPGVTTPDSQAIITS